MNNFSTFFAQAMKDKCKKATKGKYKGQPRSLKNRELRPQGPAYYRQPGKSDAPSASTFTVKG